MKKTLAGMCLFCMMFCGCSTVTPNMVTQASTIDALMAGAYDGSMSCKELLEYGDFGIGTFDRLDGEMIITNGRVYQVKADGNVYRPGRSVLTPFAAVCRFTPDNRFNLQPKAGFQKVQETIDNVVPNQNVFCAVRIRGKFSRMKTRSVPAQTKPYLPLAEVTKTQPVFELENVGGTIVGFRCPSFVKGVNVPGYHLHFINDDFTKGGHILDFVLEEGMCEVDVCHKYLLILPEGGNGLEDIDLSVDRSKELEEVEKGGGRH